MDPVQFLYAKQFGSASNNKVIASNNKVSGTVEDMAHAEVWSSSRGPLLWRVCSAEGLKDLMMQGYYTDDFLCVQHP